MKSALQVSLIKSLGDSNCFGSGVTGSNVSKDGVVGQQVLCMSAESSPLPTRVDVGHMGTLHIMTRAFAFKRKPRIRFFFSGIF